jgi:hypothetical protein
MGDLDDSDSVPAFRSEWDLETGGMEEHRGEGEGEGDAAGVDAGVSVVVFCLMEWPFGMVSRAL